MTYLITVLVFLVVFSILILIHELGHFVMAKRAGIKVEEFGLGLPPRIWGKKKGETIYSINWIPFGGFVRMYGEGKVTKKVLDSNRSFAGKPMRARVKVVIAGVLMNFLLAWALMVTGFTVGMQPLLVPDEILEAVNQGQIVVEPGLKIKEVEALSLADELGFSQGDIVYAFNNKVLTEIDLPLIGENPVGTFTLLGADREFRDILVDESFFKENGSDLLGVTFYGAISFPRVVVFGVGEGSDTYISGFREGDVLLSVNGMQIYDMDDFESLTRGVSTLEYKVFRDGFVETIFVDNVDAKKIVLVDVIPSSPAVKSGLLPQDIILSVGGESIVEIPVLIDFLTQRKGETVSFVVQRGDENLFFDVDLDENGKLGVFLSELVDYGDGEKLVLYNSHLLSSVIEIKDEKYPFHISLYKAFGETYKLSKFTVIMFVDFVSGLIQKGEISANVAGPVGIAQMTHLFVQEGFISVLRFVAVLSLSLAVINILPFPALDGGRLFFILIEFVRGKPVPQKWESYVHAFGYVLILMLILVVTYSDIVRLIKGN